MKAFYIGAAHTSSNWNKLSQMCYEYKLLSQRNQCLMLRYELDVLTVVIRYITTKCLHEWKIVHWEWNIRSEYSRIVLDWRLLLVWSGLYVPTCRAISQQRLIYPMPSSQGWLSKMQLTNKLLRTFSNRTKFMDGMNEKSKGRV